MKEVEKIPLSGYKSISTFSGCGGSSLGLRQAGFKCLWASEFIKEAQDVYHANFPTTIIDRRDIREVTADEIMKAIKMKPGQLDLLEGSPPCSSFSTIGSREKAWGKVKKYSLTGKQVKQRTDDLFFEYVRLLTSLQPRMFVAENVSGLVKGVAIGYFKEILKELESCGYVVKARVLDASRLGVPQQRERLIFIGARKDLKIEPAHPKPLKEKMRLIDALPELAEWKKIDKQKMNKDTRLPNSYMNRWFDIEPGKTDDKFFGLSRTHPMKPCPTVCQSAHSAAGVTHPFEPRRFTIEELRRICGFPGDFILNGNYRQNWERLGRAVPPPMMYHIGVEIRKTLDSIKEREHAQG